MNKYIRISLAVAALLLMSTMPSQAERGGGEHGGGWGGGHGGGWGGGGGGRGGGGGGGRGPEIGFGVGLGLGYPYYADPYYPYAPYYPYYNPVPIVQQPAGELYVQPAPQPTVEPTYWYYCKDPAGYYPSVQRCPSGWMKVVPSSPRPQ